MNLAAFTVQLLLSRLQLLRMPFSVCCEKDEMWWRNMGESGFETPLDFHIDKVPKYLPRFHWGEVVCGSHFLYLWNSIFFCLFPIRCERAIFAALVEAESHAVRWCCCQIAYLSGSWQTQTGCWCCCLNLSQSGLDHQICPRLLWYIDSIAFVSLFHCQLNSWPIPSQVTEPS